jgi:hypothetical protein
MKKSTILTALVALVSLLALGIFIACQKSSPTQSPSQESAA